jgi:hypothetical protein
MTNTYTIGGPRHNPSRKRIASPAPPPIPPIGPDTQLISAKDASALLLEKYSRKLAASGIERKCKTDWADYEGLIFRRAGKAKFLIHVQALYAAIADPRFKL